VAWVSWKYSEENVAAGKYYVNTLRTGDTDFRLYITTVQDG